MSSNSIVSNVHNEFECIMEGTNFKKHSSIGLKRLSSTKKSFTMNCVTSGILKNKIRIKFKRTIVDPTFSVPWGRQENNIQLILKKENIKMYDGFNWPRIRSSGRFV
jgi:hypothetical protein